MLNAFRNRLFKAKQAETTSTSGEETASTQGEKKESETATSNNSAKSSAEEYSISSFTSILTHKLDIDDEIRMKVIDANVADHERYDIYDPRNPLNKRKRDESREITREKKSRPIGGTRELL